MGPSSGFWDPWLGENARAPEESRPQARNSKTAFIVNKMTVDSRS